MRRSRHLGRSLSYGQSDYETKQAELQNSYNEFLLYNEKCFQDISNSTEISLSEKRNHLITLKATYLETQAQYNQALYSLNEEYGLLPEEASYLHNAGAQFNNGSEFSGSPQPDNSNEYQADEPDYSSQAHGRELDDGFRPEAAPYDVGQTQGEEIDDDLRPEAVLDRSSQIQGEDLEEDFRPEAAPDCGSQAQDSQEYTFGQNDVQEHEATGMDYSW